MFFNLFLFVFVWVLAIYGSVGSALFVADWHPDLNQSLGSHFFLAKVSNKFITPVIIFTKILCISSFFADILWPKNYIEIL